MALDFEAQFRELVPLKFEFLGKEFGFHFVQDRPWRYVADSLHCRVVMEYEKSHFACWIERRELKLIDNDSFRAISVDLISICKGHTPALGPIYLSKEAILRKEIDTAVTFIRKYCAPYLRGDFSDWSDVVGCLQQREARLRQEEVREAEKWRLRSVREEAAEAWVAKNYPEVVRAYDSIIANLTETERRKLAFAKKRLSSKG
jgi:hypothetical protein